MSVGLAIVTGLSAAERTYVSEKKARCYAWTEVGPSQGHWECDAENQQCICVVDTFTGWEPITKRRVQHSDPVSATTVRTAPVSVPMSRS